MLNNTGLILNQDDNLDEYRSIKIADYLAKRIFNHNIVIDAFAGLGQFTIAVMYI